MDALESEDVDDPRRMELSSLEAIFPEIQRVKQDDPYTIALELPVNPTKAVAVFFPAAADAAAPTTRVDAGPNDLDATADVVAHAVPVDSHELAYLPSVHLEIYLSAAYPAEQPPAVTISTRPPWIPPETVKRLEGDAARLWEDMGRDIVVFTYIDHIQQSSEEVFGLVGAKGGLEIDPSHKIAILDYDIEAKRRAFEKETFDCGVCLDPKKGSVCHRMLDCGHVFCTECLQDFYNNAIKEGDLASVRCLAPSCTKERVKAAESAGKKRKQPKIFYISPSELLQIPLEPDVVKRYVALKYKTELESDKNTIYCPRSWCNGAARSKKHKKPEGFELAEHVSDEESEPEEEEQDATGNGQTTYKPFQPTQDLLAICEDCGFAFCSRCSQSWHGEFYRCRPRNNKDELTEEEKASLDYLKLHTTPCPTCAAPVQKTHGCNHMICYRCQSHFCYLCSAWLNPSNPYQHFNETSEGKRTSCYQRLWELEGGDGDDVGIGFAGGRAQQPAVRPLAAVQGPPVMEIEEGENSDVDEGAGEPAQEPAGAAHDGQVGVAREGPLVLRIAGGHRPAGAGRGGPRGRAARDPEPARRQQLGQQPGGRGQAAARGQGRGRARGRAGRAGGDARRGRGPEIGAVRRAIGGLGAEEGNGAMNPAEEAWVRRFVRLALNDEEDLLFDIADDLDPDFILEERDDASSDNDDDA